MHTAYRTKFKSVFSYHKNPMVLCLDLAIYISVMFLIREVYFAQFNVMTNGLFWSLTTLVVAIIFMRIRGTSWQEIGLCRPKNYKNALLATVFIFTFTIISILIFQTVKEQIGWQVAPDNADEKAASKFGELAGNWQLFFTIIPLFGCNQS
jgi:hypothetical protein